MTDPRSRSPLLPARWRRLLADVADYLDRRESPALEFAAVLSLLALYCARFLPQVFISDSIPKLALPLAFSYYADTLLFVGWKANPLIRDVVVSTAAVCVNYPFGLFSLIRAAQWVLGGTILDLNALLFAIQTLTPVFSYLIFRRFTHRLWAVLLAWFVTSRSVYIYSMPDFYNQVLILASIWLLLRAYESERLLLLIPAGILCGLNVAVKQNIGLAWSAAAVAFIFFENARSCDVAPPERSSRWLGLVAAVVFLAYGAVVTSMFATWDNRILFTLPFAVFWAWVLVRFVRRDLVLDDRALARDVALFAATFACVALGVFAAYSWDIGFQRYFDFLFRNCIENRDFWDQGVSVRGLLYYGKDGRLDLLAQGRLKMLLLWFAPFAANLGLVVWLLRRRTSDLPAAVAKLPMIALSIVGVYTLFPLESYFNLSTKLCLPLIAVAVVFSGSPRGNGVSRIGALLLTLAVLAGFGKQMRHCVRLFAECDKQLTWMPGQAGVYLPRSMTAELQRSVALLQAHIDGKFYVIGSHSADLSMYYRLLGAGFASYYTDLRESFLSPRAEDDLIRVLEDYPCVIVEKDDLDLRLENPPRGNRTLARVLGYIGEEYRTVATYLRPAGGEYAGLQDFYVMCRREGRSSVTRTAAQTRSSSPSVSPEPDGR